MKLKNLFFSSPPFYLPALHGSIASGVSHSLKSSDAVVIIFSLFLSRSTLPPVIIALAD